MPGTREELSDDVFSAHVGLGYDGSRSRRNFYIKPDARLRWYELEGFGPDGGKDSQITYELRSRSAGGSAVSRPR